VVLKLLRRAAAKKGFPGPQPAGASDALKAAHSGMQVCQWQLVQINPAARSAASAALAPARPAAPPGTSICFEIFQ